MKRVLIITMLLALAVGPLATPASAKTIQLKFSSFFPDAHGLHTAVRWYVNEIEKRTEGKIKMTLFTGGALGKSPEAVDNILKGIADLGMVGPHLHPGRFPAWDVFTIPLLFPNPPSVQFIGWDLHDRGFLKIKGLKTVAICGVEDNRVFLTKNKIETIEDFKGKILVVYGAWKSAGFAKLGASPTDTSVGETYMALERGIAEGAVLGVGLALPLKITDVAKYAIWNPFGQAMANVYMNEKVWRSIPPELQVIMEQVNQEFNYRLQDTFCQAEIRGLEAFKKAGTEVYKLNDKEWAKAKKAIDPVIDEWVRDMESKGLPGQKIIDVVRWDLQKMGYQ